MRKILVLVGILILVCSQFVEAQSKVEELGLKGPVKTVEEVRRFYNVKDKEVSNYYQVLQYYFSENKKLSWSHVEWLQHSEKPKEFLSKSGAFYDEKERVRESSVSTTYYYPIPSVYKVIFKNDHTLVHFGELSKTGRILTTKTLATDKRNEWVICLFDKFEYNERDQLVKKIHYNIVTTEIETVETYQYDEKGFLAFTQKKMETGDIQEESYSYNEQGWMSEKKRVYMKKGQIESEILFRYVYDDLDSYGNWRKKILTKYIVKDGIEYRTSLSEKEDLSDQGAWYSLATRTITYYE